MDAGRRWMLVRDFGADVLEPDYDRPLPPLARWEAAVRCFARLQIEAAAHVGEWLALGCADWRGPRLARRFGELAGDDAALGRGESWGLSDAEIRQLRRLVPRVAELCAHLTSVGVPDSLVHLDFSGRNIVPAGGGFLFYDWSDAAVGHPFFSGANVVRDVRYPIEEPTPGPSGVPAVVALSGAARQRFVRDAYLEPWTAYAPAEGLRKAFGIAARLRPVWRAVRSHRELPSVEPASPWAADLARSIPAELRDAIVQLAR
jgi:hypothetical protein